MLCGIRVIFFGISLNGGKTWYKGRTFYLKMLYILFVRLFLWGKKHVTRQNTRTVSVELSHEHV